MQQFIDIDQAHSAGPTFLTVGNFDGLHQGHKALLRRMQQLADASYREGRFVTRPQTGIITFEPHPLAVLHPAHMPLLLSTPQERLALAAQFGIEIGVIQTFTPALAQLDAHAFMSLLKHHLQLVALVVGPDFALGRNRSGDLATLRRLGEALDYELHVVEPFAQQEKTVRSSTIRQALSEGDVVTAAGLLGYYYNVTGLVVEGDRRGRQLGFPTANIETAPTKLLPANGVYATLVTLGAQRVDKRFQSVTNLGVRPTVDGLHRRLETHLLNFPVPGINDNLYGQVLRVEFLARLRDEQRFSGLEALVAQILTDIAQAQQIFQQHAPPIPV
jgi:riboflavin kinase/FMN adenylyltransferase